MGGKNSCKLMPEAATIGHFVLFWSRKLDFYQGRSGKSRNFEK